MNQIALQEILGTNKKNPYLLLLREKDSKNVHIYYGTHLLEIVADNPQHIGFRSAVGRLYNAGLNRKLLSDVFGFDRRIMQSWGNALTNKNPEEAMRILSGRTRYKMSTEIIQFARVRFLHIYPTNRYSYSKQIRQEIEETFQISICSESLRPLFNIWKQEYHSKNRAHDEIFTDAPITSKSQQTCECYDDEYHDKNLTLKQIEQVDNNNNRKFNDGTDQPQWFIRHGGICIFASYITKIGDLFGNFGFIVKQWLCMILLEAVNIEQSKYLDFNSLARILGQTMSRPLRQRKILSYLASEEQNCTKIFKLNARLCNCSHSTDFYYDPHVKHYTGMSKILKGWCSSIGHADKVLHSDFIHSSGGQPLFFMHCDNYYDLRERYQIVVRAFRRCVGIAPTRCITLILDRGIYSFRVFDSILDDPSVEIITWEKDFKPRAKLWESNPVSRFCIEKYRNSSTDRKVYYFKYIDRAWDNKKDMRHLVVQATNPFGKVVELGVLTSDHKRDAQEIITLIFKRWIQENDFKYLDKHYGINQIISYATVDYAKLKQILTDKQVVSGTYKALQHEKIVVEQKLKNLIYRKHCRHERVVEARRQVNEIEMQIKHHSFDQCQDAISEMKKRCRVLKSNLSRWSKKGFDDEIKKCSDQLKQTVLRLEENKATTSKLDTLIQQGYQRLDIRKKKFMDVLKIYARNIFYHEFQNFRLAYDNYRDDHEYFRNVTHADGIYREFDESVEIMLYPRAHLEPKMKNIVKNILVEITQNLPMAPDGSGRKLILTLKEDETLKVADV